MIRNQIFEAKLELGKERRKLLNNAIIEKLYNSSFYKEANHIMVYVSFGSEINTHDFIKESLKKGKRISVPVTFPDSKEIKPSELLDFDELEIGFYNILTPKDESIRFIDPNEIDLIIVPGVAFDRKGYRIGYGGGYYDRFLSSYPDIIKLSIAYDLQLIDEVPRKDHDIPVDFIITEKEVIKLVTKIYILW